jgi:raffinose/stachyose/melibiose transport system substrate-binding protein
MLNFKKIVVLLIVLVMAFSLLACKAEEKVDDTEKTAEATEKATEKPTEEATEEVSEEPIDMYIVLANVDDTRKGVNDRIEEGIEAAFPNVNFEIERATDYGEKVKTLNAIGDLPDVFFNDSKETIKSLITSGTVLDLRPYIEEDGFADKYDIKTAIAPHTDGGVYNLQSGADQYFITTLFYNKDVFAEYNVEVPVTFDEFVAACEVFKQNDIIPISAFLTDCWSVQSNVLPNLIAAEDPTVITKLQNLEANFATDPVVLSALEKFALLANNGYFGEDALNRDYGTAQTYFIEGEAAMYPMFTWAAADFVDYPNIGVMAWPQVNPDIDTTDRVIGWGTSYTGYLVGKNSENVDVAVKVAEYCAFTEAEYFNEVSKMPTSLNTGIEIEGIADIVQIGLDRIANAEENLP